ncbi:MAG: hypothetical protein GY853_15335 [PVC group bacterium]|nr:hypothetical protein [PVC group bacterium]
MADVYYAICSDAFWATPNWAGKGSEVARDAYYDGHYTACSTWESARDGAASAGDTEYGEICGTWASADTNTFAFSGWDNTVNIVLKTVGDARHSGKWDDTNCHRLVASSGASIINAADGTTVIFDGLQVNNTVAGDSTSYGIYSASAITLTISNCIIPVSGDGNSIFLNNAGLVGKIWNCLCYATGSQGASSEGIFVDSVNTCDIYNTVVKNFNDGIERDASVGATTVTNCAVYDNADDFDGTMTITYCASDDGDGSNSVDAPTWADQFTDDSTYDFTLKAGNSLEDAGTDDPGSGLYSADIAGTAYTSTWPIGAFEESAAGGTTHDLDSSLSSLSDTTSTVARMRAFPVDMETTSQLNISVQRQRSLISAINTLSDLNAELQAVTFTDLESVIQNASEVTGTLNRLRALRSDINTISEIAGTLLSEGAVELSAGIVNASSLTATLARLRAFFSQIANTSEVNGTIITEAFITLSTVIQNTTELTNEIARLRSLVSTIQNDSDVTGVLNRLRALELSVANVSQVVGNIAQAITKGNFWRITLTQDAMFKNELSQDAKFKTTLTEDAMFGIELEDK